MNKNKKRARIDFRMKLSKNINKMKPYEEYLSENAIKSNMNKTSNMPKD